MNPSVRGRISTTLFAVLFLILLASSAMAGSPDTLANDINKAIRTAEKATFNGKWQEAAQIMAEVELKLGELKAAAPGHRKLKSLESAFDRLQKKIERKLGAGSKPASTAKPQPAPKPAPKAASPAASAQSGKAKPQPAAGAISHGAARRLDEMIKQLERAEAVLQKGGGDLGAGSLKRAQSKYAELEKRHANELSAPEITQAKARMDDLAARIDQAKKGASQAAEQQKAAQKDQAALLEKWRKDLTAYSMPNDPKYLGRNPGLVPEAEALLSALDNENFPLGRPAELDGYVQSLKNDIAKAKAQAGAADIDQKWLPRVKPFITSNDPSYIDPMGPDFNQPQRVAAQEATLAKGQALLDEYNKSFPDGKSTHFLDQAINDLKNNLNNYAESKTKRTGDLEKRMADTLALWTGQMQKNQGWTGESGKPLYLISDQALKEFKQNLARLEKVQGAAGANGKKMGDALAGLEKQNSAWRQKKVAWENAPKPFPKAGMTSNAMQKAMLALLADRGWKSIKKLVIVDKDWWVLKGEYRYMKAAFLSQDENGEFFCYAIFKQNATLAGYGPTELWEVHKKTRLAK